MSQLRLSRLITQLFPADFCEIYNADILDGEE
jgi:hypothetical protein